MNYEVNGQIIGIQKFLGMEQQGVKITMDNQSLPSQIIGGSNPIVGFVQSLFKHLMGSVTDNMEK